MNSARPKNFGPPHIVARLSAEFVEIEVIARCFQATEGEETEVVLPDNRRIRMPRGEGCAEVEHRVRNTIESSQIHCCYIKPPRKATSHILVLTWTSIRAFVGTIAEHEKGRSIGRINLFPKLGTSADVASNGSHILRRRVGLQLGDRCV